MICKWYQRKSRHEFWTSSAAAMLALALKGRQKNQAMSKWLNKNAINGLCWTLLDFMACDIRRPVIPVIPVITRACDGGSLAESINLEGLSRNVSKCLEMSRNVSKCLEMSRRFQSSKGSKGFLCVVQREKGLNKSLCTLWGSGEGHHWTAIAVDMKHHQRTRVKESQPGKWWQMHSM